MVMATVWYARSRGLRYAAFLQGAGTTTIRPGCRAYLDAAETKIARDSNPYGRSPAPCRGGEGRLRPPCSVP